MEKTMNRYEIGDHFYSVVECSCEMCNKSIPIDSEIVVTSFGGYANPVFGFSCINCVDRANRKAGL